ncbi:MAG: UbiA prenyltransferase family protein [bacterium]|nr:UbiA prenyltransferase family protein [bacterium]
MASNPKLLVIVRATRPRQWIKNLLVLSGLFFARKLLDPKAVERALGAFIIFCLLTGAIYLINDVIDYPRDRLHPEKRRRPVASGDLSIQTAVLAACILAAVGLAASFLISLYFGMCAAAYFLMMAAYSVSLKDVFIIDTMIIALGFIIRAVSGVIVLRTPQTRVPLTSWFVICVMFLSLLLAFCKRRSERVRYNEDALATRPVLAMYSLPLLDLMIGVCATGAILSYTLYATSAHSAWNMWLWLATLPFVLFGIFRYLFLVYNLEDGEAPEIILTRDAQMLGCIGLWGLSLVAVFIFSTA